MVRYGSFHVMTECGKCGQPVPVNGPLLTVECSHCFAERRIAASSLVDIFESLEEDYNGLEEGDGHGVQSMGGNGTYKYTYLRRRPQCAKCKTALDVDVVPTGAQFELACPGCDARWPTFPAPEWLQAEMPSAAQCFCADGEASGGGAPSLSLDQDVPEAIAMSCPGCGAGLRVTGDWERTHPCEFCQVHVFIPDALWRRLHPVKTARHWGVRFEGPTQKQLVSEENKRAADRLAEEARAAPMPANAKARCVRYVEEAIASGYSPDRVSRLASDIEETLSGRVGGADAARLIRKLLEARNGKRALRLLAEAGSFPPIAPLVVVGLVVASVLAVLVWAFGG